MSLQYQFSTHNLSELLTSSASVIKTTNSLSTRSQGYLCTRSLVTASAKATRLSETLRLTSKCFGILTYFQEDYP